MASKSKLATGKFKTSTQPNSTQLKSLETLKFEKNKKTVIAEKAELEDVILKQRIKIAKLEKINKTETAKCATLSSQLKDYQSRYKASEKRCMEVKEGCEVYQKECTVLKDKLVKLREESESKLETQGKKIKDMTEKMVANRSKMAELHTQLTNQQAEWENKYNNLLQNLQEAQELVNKTIKEKEDIASELTKVKEDHQSQVKSILQQNDKEVEKVKQSVTNLHIQIHDLNYTNRELQTNIKRLDKVIRLKNKEINDLKHQIQVQDHTIETNKTALRLQTKEKKKLLEQLDEQQQKETILESSVHLSKKTQHVLQDEVDELKKHEKKIKLDLKMMREENQDMNEKLQFCKSKLKISQSTLKSEKEKYEILECKQRNILAGLEGCRDVLQDRAKLKKKVSSMIEYYIAGNTKAIVDKDAHYLNSQLVEYIQFYKERTERILTHYEREKIRNAKVAHNAKKRDLNEKMDLINYIHDQRMQQKNEPAKKHTRQVSNSNLAMCKQYRLRSSVHGGYC
ncbi:rho-associated protein kinase 1-like [Boleophthalmus pectinirostris]|uniref:rho-associated protein kinase 1-like n=1 Tax=Boleophthalmus pectinirostris TaxID=150288 RepID=UPI00242B7773|nr:rho-associated protein kinase 1-like [Boleophthalmus pectinirostris]